MAHPDHGGSPAAFRRCLGALRVASAPRGAEVSGGAEVALKRSRVTHRNPARAIYQAWTVAHCWNQTSKNKPIKSM